MKVHVSLNYHEMKVDELDVFAEGVNQGTNGNDPPFVAPPVNNVAFLALIATFVTTRAAYRNGGSAQKPAFITAKDNLMKALDDTAAYVDGIADGDSNIITLSGFVPTKATESEGHAPTQPDGVKITRGAKGELMAECATQVGVTFFGCIVTAGAPLPDGTVIDAAGQLSFVDLPNVIFDLNKNRKKKFIGLSTGKEYYFYFYAVNATGVSPLSEVRNLMCG